LEETRPKLQLSEREKQLIQLASSGFTDTAIAHKLGISEATVGTYWGRIRIKLGPYSRTELVAIVLRSEQEEALNKLREENERLVYELERSAGSSSDEGYYQQIIENAPDAMVVVTETGILTAANQAAHELFGYQGGAMRGISLLDLIPHRYREVHQAHREEYVQNPKRRAMGEHLETPAIKRNGEEFLVRASLSVITTPDGLIITCAVRAVDPH